MRGLCLSGYSTTHATVDCCCAITVIYLGSMRRLCLGGYCAAYATVNSCCAVTVVCFGSMRGLCLSCYSAAYTTVDCCCAISIICFGSMSNCSYVIASRIVTIGVTCIVEYVRLCSSCYSAAYAAMDRSGTVTVIRFRCMSNRSYIVTSRIVTGCIASIVKHVRLCSSCYSATYGTLGSGATISIIGFGGVRGLCLSGYSTTYTTVDCCCAIAVICLGSMSDCSYVIASCVVTGRVTGVIKHVRLCRRCYNIAVLTSDCSSAVTVVCFGSMRWLCRSCFGSAYATVNRCCTITVVYLGGMRGLCLGCYSSAYTAVDCCCAISVIRLGSMSNYSYVIASCVVTGCVTGIVKHVGLCRCGFDSAYATMDSCGTVTVVCFGSMAKSRNMFIVNIAVATYGAGVSGISIFRTGRRSYQRLIFMAKSRNKLSMAYSTFP